MLLRALSGLPVAGVVESPRPVAGEPCNCEHENHGTDFMGKQVPLKGHLPMAVFAGSQRAEFVGAVCDDCARDCVAEYLVDQSAKSVDDPWSAESRLAVVLAELRSEMAGARYVALLGNADLLGTQAADELANDEIRARAEDRVARCQRLIALAGGAE